MGSRKGSTPNRKTAQSLLPEASPPCSMHSALPFYTEETLEKL